MRNKVITMLYMAVVFLIVLVALFARRTVIERREVKKLIMQADSLGFARGIETANSEKDSILNIAIGKLKKTIMLYPIQYSDSLKDSTFYFYIDGRLLKLYFK